MILDTQMTLALLQELLIALSANDADGYKCWLTLGIEELGRDVAGEVDRNGWCLCWLRKRETGLWFGSWVLTSSPFGGIAQLYWLTVG